MAILSIKFATPVPYTCLTGVKHLLYEDSNLRPRLIGKLINEPNHTKSLVFKHSTWFEIYILKRNIA